MVVEEEEVEEDSTGRTTSSVISAKSTATDVVRRVSFVVCRAYWVGADIRVSCSQVTMPITVRIRMW